MKKCQCGAIAKYKRLCFDCYVSQHRVKCRDCLNPASRLHDNAYFCRPHFYAQRQQVA